MISRREVKAAAALAFPADGIHDLTRLTNGLDFEVHRVDLTRGGSVVFRGQCNYTSEYLGFQDFGKILSWEIEFYKRLPHLPVPSLLHFQPDNTVLGFPFAFFTYLPGKPLSELLTKVSDEERRATMSRLGCILTEIHKVTLDKPGRLTHETATTWAEYMTRRMSRRLQPHLASGLVTSTQLETLLEKTSHLWLKPPRLLHMDFRPVNMLAELKNGSINITGIVDAANALAGDPAMELARIEEGAGYNEDLFAAYQEAFTPADRRSETYLIYRLETAALLASVYQGTSEYEYRKGRLLSLTAELAAR